MNILILMVILPCLILAATLTVKQDGTGDYTVIQTAIDAANPGDTVLVYPGRYFESLMIQTNNISLSSLEATAGNQSYVDSTIVDGTGSIGGIIVGQFKIGINIRGFSVTNGMSPGIALGQSSETSVTNCKIFGRTSKIGGGINIGGATVTLSGVQIFDNYAMQLGGGVYADSGGGYVNNITFDPVNRCSIYNNRAGSGQDIYIQNATSNLDVPLDIFTVAEPSSYYATYISASPNNFNTYQINFDILHAHRQEIDSDVYVSTIGDDSNDGLSPITALKTIHEAIYRVASDSLNQNTVHILPGEYSRTDNDQIFPIALKSWVIVQGSGIDTTTVIGEPHPEFYENTSTWIFSMISEPSIYLSDMSITARNTIRNCVVMTGTHRQVNMSFSNLRIHDFTAHESYTGSYDAISLTATSARESTWKNVVIENYSNSNGGILDIAEGNMENGTISAFMGSFKNCIFRNATSTYTSGSVMGPALISIKGDKILEFENCVFENLSVADDDANVIQISDIQFPQQQNHYSFNNSLFSNISSHDNMVVIKSTNNPRIDVTNCTFAGNQGDAYTLKINGEVNIVNSIFWNDTPYQIKVNDMDGNPNEHTNLTIDHSLVKDGIAGILPYPVPGNTIDFLASSINADPLFAGGFDIHDPEYYSLSELSPCINSGTPNTLGLFLPPYDLAGNYRVWDGRIDMGCFEFGAPPVANDDPIAPDIPAFSLTAYPNPFNVFTNIRVSSLNSVRDRSERVNNASITIYNIKGQRVKNITLDPQKTGEQFTYWDG
ncbi:MAG: hypothetical protein WC195_07625, partial [Bacteroidales bacterium]